MELRVIQNWLSKYSLLSSDEQLSVIIEIQHDGKPVTVGGHRARLQFMADPDERIDNPIENLSGYMTLALEYSKNIASTVNYGAQTMAFTTVLRDNWDEINDNFRQNRIDEIAKEIADLESEARGASVDRHVLDTAADFAHNEIDKLTKWKAMQEEAADDFKEGSPSHTKAMETILRYELEIAGWESLL